MSASSDTRTASSRLPRIGLIPQILIGIVAGLILASLAPSTAASFAILGDLFIGALKAVAPILVFVLVMAAIASHQRGQLAAGLSAQDKQAEISIELDIDESKAIPVLMKAGEAVVFHCWTLHKSVGNR
ncbi:cation:dicarboxylate symporter family transporter [Salinicola salarius]|uniref:cation:dicarboxylate symporter family transporter n=1 Tax=Salinicola salarius TaxID=430457 RepID=UPI0026EAA446|nr:cation:dicarboxylase symporter family transporter [Salinicola salarius]